MEHKAARRRACVPRLFRVDKQVHVHRLPLALNANPILLKDVIGALILELVLWDAILHVTEPYQSRAWQLPKRVLLVPQ